MKRLLKREKIIQVKMETENAETDKEVFTDIVVCDQTIEKDGGFKCKIEGGKDGLDFKDPGLVILLRGCGIVKPLEFSIAPGSIKIIKIRPYEDGFKKILRNAVGNVTIEDKNGKLTSARFEFYGIWSDTPDS